MRSHGEAILALLRKVQTTTDCDVCSVCAYRKIGQVILTAVNLTHEVDSSLKVPQKLFGLATGRCKGKPHTVETQIMVGEPL